MPKRKIEKNVFVSSKRPNTGQRLTRQEMYQLSGLRCKDCKRGFASESSFRIHQKKKHGRKVKRPVRPDKYVSDVPGLMLFWDTVENEKLGLDPSKTLTKSQKKAAWFCPKSVCMHPHRFTFAIYNFSILPILCLLSRWSRFL